MQHTPYKDALENENGNITKAAERMGIARSTFRERYRKEASQDLAEHLVPSKIPSGVSISGTSTLYRPPGETVLQWVKTKVEQPTLEETIAAIKDGFKEFDPRKVKLPEPKATKQDPLLTLYPLADLHYGMYSWSEETGDDYDITIADRIVAEAFGKLVASSASSHNAVLLNLGDFFHSDNDEQRTRRSGNKLDVDTRYAKVLRSGVELMLRIVELLLQRHQNVLIKNLRGNHDPYGVLALTVALAAYYSTSNRVIVDVDARDIWTHLYGKTLIAATHGDMAKPEDLPGIVAANWPTLWGNSTIRYGLVGHIHNSKVWPERHGMKVEAFQTLAPKDAWGASMGFTAGRSLHAITYSPTQGEIERHTVNLIKKENKE